MSLQVTFEKPFASGLGRSDLLAETEEALAALDDIDARYERERDGIRAWVGPERSKERLFAHLQARRHADRQPIVEWLLELRHSLQRSTFEKQR